MEFAYLFLVHNPKEFKECKTECEFSSYFHVNLSAKNSSISCPCSLFTQYVKRSTFKQMSFLSGMHSLRFSDSLRLPTEGEATSIHQQFSLDPCSKISTRMNKRSEYALELVLMICVFVFVIKPDTLEKNKRKYSKEIKRCIPHRRKMSRTLFPYFVTS